MEWLTTLGVPAILATVIPLMITRHYDRQDKRAANNDEHEQRLDSHDEELKAMKSDIIQIKSEISDFKNTLRILAAANQSILRDRIIQMYNVYYIDKGYMPIYARESLDHMFTEYKNLQGNGVVPGLVEAMLSLPTEPEGVEE